MYSTQKLQSAIGLFPDRLMIEDAILPSSIPNGILDEFTDTVGFIYFCIVSNSDDFSTRSAEEKNQASIVKIIVMKHPSVKTNDKSTLYAA